MLHWCRGDIGGEVVELRCRLTLEVKQWNIGVGVTMEMKRWSLGVGGVEVPWRRQHKMWSITGEGASTLGGPLHSVYFFVTSSLRLAAMLFSSRATLQEPRIGHILCRNCILKHVIEGKVEGRGKVRARRGRRRKQLLDDIKEMRGYWKLKEIVLRVYRTVWRIRFGRGYGPVVRQTTEWAWLSLKRIEVAYFFTEHILKHSTIKAMQVHIRVGDKAEKATK